MSVSAWRSSGRAPLRLATAQCEAAIPTNDESTNDFDRSAFHGDHFDRLRHGGLEVAWLYRRAVVRRCRSHGAFLLAVPICTEGRDSGPYGRTQRIYARERHGKKWLDICWRILCGNPQVSANVLRIPRFYAIFRTKVRFPSRPPIYQRQRLSVGVFICVLPRVRGDWCGCLRTARHGQNRHSGPDSTIPKPIFSPPLPTRKKLKSAKAAIHHLINQRLTRGRIKQFYFGIGRAGNAVVYLPERCDMENREILKLQATPQRPPL